MIQNRNSGVCDCNDSGRHDLIYDFVMILFSGSESSDALAS